MHSLNLLIICFIAVFGGSSVDCQFFDSGLSALEHGGFGHGRGGIGFGGHGGFGHGHGHGHGFGQNEQSHHSSSSIRGGVIKFGTIAADSESNSHSNNGFAFRSDDQEEPMLGYASPSDSPTSYRSISSHSGSTYAQPTVPCPKHILISCLPNVQTVPCQQPSYGSSY